MNLKEKAGGLISKHKTAISVRRCGFSHVAKNRKFSYNAMDQEDSGMNSEQRGWSRSFRSRICQHMSDLQMFFRGTRQKKKKRERRETK